MDKKDMTYLAAALVLVLVIALVIKPLATGQPIKTGISVPTTTIPRSSMSAEGPMETTYIPMTTYVVLTEPPTPIPTWDPKSSQEVSFVDPSKYGVSFNQSIPQGTRFNETKVDMNMTTFATIASSKGLSGTTHIMYIPFPYWELVYTVTPSDPLKPETIKITPTLGEGLSYSGVSGSYSTSSPQFTLQVMDGDDPNRIVRTVTPPGGINLNLWKGVVPTAKEVMTPIDVSGASGVSGRNYYANRITRVVPTPTPIDPRPWTEKFYEGQRNYYFIITAQSLDSYKIEIKVPTRYIGKY